MLREQARLFNRLTVLTDFGIILFSFVVAYYLRVKFVNLREFYTYLWVLIVVFPTWYVLFSRHNLYQSIRKRSFFDIFTSLCNVHVLGGLFVASFIYMLDKHFSRSLYGYFLALSWTLFIVERFVLKHFLSFARRKGYNVRSLLIIGSGESATNLAHLVHEHQDWGLRIVGFLTEHKDSDGAGIPPGEKVLGSVDDLVSVCKAHQIDEVVFCLSKEHLGDFDATLKTLEMMGVTVRMILEFFEVTLYRKELSFFHDTIPILTFHPKAFDAQQLFLKRCLDLSGSCVGLIVLGLCFPFIAIAIKIDSPGPIFFAQNRVGMNGRDFRLWKFRSMYIDAEKRRKEVEHRNEMSGAMFKLEDDPRITRVGKFLRKTSLDELPQFFNVFKNDMSLVGTRPPTPQEVSQYENWHHRRICIKPGITGKWQVSGRSEIKKFDEIVKLDLEYIDGWNIWLDLKILLKTCWVVLVRKGSC